ncbi:MAG: M1 family metallopeptidase [Bacteroidales bacterium]
MLSKNLLLILVFQFFFLASFAQVDPYYEEGHICKHQNKEYPFDFQKSIINPNPLVFKYDVNFYKLDIEAYDTTNQFSGNAVVKATVTAALLDTFSIELSNKLSADSVFINGVKHSFQHTGHDIIVELVNPLSINDEIEFQLFYHTPPAYSSAYFTATVAPTYGNFNVSQTLSEPYFAHEWMPCKQELEDKADSVHIFITTDNDLKVAGPGTLTEVLLPNGMVRHEWRTNYPTAFYLIFFAISDYQAYNIYAKPDSLYGDSLLIMNYVYDYPNCLESNKAAIDNTPAMIELLSDLYGLFPFYKEKYGHYLWYPSGFSGMEHITMSGMRYLNTYLISHELGHSWFGDNVTCASWSDIWINEGFATYTEYLVLQYLYSQASADAKMLSYHNYVMGSPDGSVYIPIEQTNSVGRIFSTRLTYRKGGALVHMIRFEMNNDSLFFRTLYEFQQEYKDSLATGMDFKEVCEEVSGLDFDDFFNQWYIGEGFPIYDLTWWQHEDTLFIDAYQNTSTTITPLFKTSMEYMAIFAGGDTTFRVYQSSNDTVYKFILSEEVTNIAIDPNNWILNQVESIVHRKLLNLKIYLEGPYDNQTGQMSSWLNTSFIPLNQPYDQPPWNYPGTESVTQLPENVVDWVLISLYDATDISLVDESNLIETQACFLKKNGSIVSLDGYSLPKFSQDITNNLYLEILHRNHLQVFSNNALDYTKGVYAYDFSNNANQVFGGSDGHKELAPGIWGLISGNANADGLVDESDKSDSWENSAGNSGYAGADLNLDSQIDNVDKDDYWLPNLGRSAQIPQ